MASAFAFHPGLFEERARVLDHLAAHGLHWLEHFSSVDLCHETHGLEVCGIHEQGDALRIQALLRRLLPTWRHGRMYYRDPRDYERDPGWLVQIGREEE